VGTLVRRGASLDYGVYGKLSKHHTLLKRRPVATTKTNVAGLVYEGALSEQQGLFETRPALSNCTHSKWDLVLWRISAPMVIPTSWVQKF
jgi:hypothetical protein